MSHGITKSQLISLLRHTETPSIYSSLYYVTQRHQVSTLLSITSQSVTKSQLFSLLRHTVSLSQLLSIRSHSVTKSQLFSLLRHTLAPNLNSSLYYVT